VRGNLDRSRTTWGLVVAFLALVPLSAGLWRVARHRAAVEPPVVLVLPEASLTADLANYDGVDLVARGSGAKTDPRLERYQGQAVWLGPNPPDIPPEYRDQPVFKRWPEPVRLGGDLILRPGQEIRLMLSLRESKTNPPELYRDPP